MPEQIIGHDEFYVPQNYSGVEKLNELELRTPTQSYQEVSPLLRQTNPSPQRAINLNTAGNTTTRPSTWVELISQDITSE